MKKKIYDSEKKINCDSEVDLTNILKFIFDLKKKKTKTWLLLLL